MRSPNRPSPNRPWVPLLGLVLALAVAASVAWLWTSGTMRRSADDAGHKPPVDACDPPVPTGRPRPPECPQSAGPTQRQP